MLWCKDIIDDIALDIANNNLNSSAKPVLSTILRSPKSLGKPHGIKKPQAKLYSMSSVWLRESVCFTQIHPQITTYKQLVVKICRWICATHTLSRTLSLHTWHWIEFCLQLLDAMRLVQAFRGSQNSTKNRFRRRT